ncbi:MAG TPA: S46 family peptidase [Aggregicoccus sp.]|nr:S46 family peptidase [Aggregicoccus sp.]
MWTFDAFPAQAVKKAYGFEPTQAWLDAVRLASVRLAGGCSASFVSPQGLVMTNHHCIRSCVEDLSGPGRDYLEKGFNARTLQDEKRCAKVEANQLVEMTDITQRLHAATRGKTGAAFNTALKAEMTRAETECAKGASDVRCDVVTLFNGGKYSLYKYRRFQDVRLAFAPEFPMAAFGGYADNFNFPRYGFDAAFLRVWDGGRPLETKHYFPWAKAGANEGDLVFVPGHPGGTERLVSVAELEFQRDVALPTTLLELSELRGELLQFANLSPEHFRLIRARLRSVENGHKALIGRHQTLADRSLLPQKRVQEAELRRRVEADPRLKAELGSAWDETAAALEAYRHLHRDYRMKEGSSAFASELFEMARELVRAAEELPKPNGERLREYTDARLPALRQGLLSQVPIPRNVEELTLTFGLRRLREQLGMDAPFVKSVLGREAPEALARKLVRGTRLASVAERRRLLEGGKAAVEASKDPMIQLARRVDAEARAVRKRYEDTVESVLRRNGERLAKAHFAVNGMGGYPDATFTLRLSYGKVAGWEEPDERVPAMTTYAGAYERHTGKYPFALPPTWLKAKGQVPAQTPLNVATTNDIIGGNSGSPLVSREGHIVGLVFDGNLHSLGGRYGYVGATNRAVAVHGEGLMAGLEHVYGARRLVEELRAVQAK